MRVSAPGGYLNQAATRGKPDPDYRSSKDQPDSDPVSRQVDIAHHAGIMHLALTPALCDFLPQIRQPNIGTIALNQNLLSILARASALGARQAHHVTGILAELE